jgi:hypothetical protein
VAAVTHWRAIKKGLPNLREKLESLIRAGREGDQFLLGVDAGSPDLAVCEAVAASFPGRDVCLIACEPNWAENPKISKFLQMAPHAKHPHWMLTDSEAVFEGDFVERFRGEWESSGKDALTAGYRFAGIRGLPQVFDAAPVLLTLWPGLMWVRRVDFLLGACTGVRAADVMEAGGWEAFASELAEDRQLGAKLASRGLRVGLSENVLTLEADSLGWWDWLRHQHRVAVTYRQSAPVGSIGLPVLHALPLALIAAPVGASAGWWLVPVMVYLMRVGAAVSLARVLRFPLPLLPLATFVVPVVESVCWLLAWIPLPVWWAGKWRRFGKPERKDI